MFLPEEHLAGAAAAAPDPFADDLPSLLSDLPREPARSGPCDVLQQAEAQRETDCLWSSCALQTRDAALGDVDVTVDNEKNYPFWTRYGEGSCEECGPANLPGKLPCRAAPLLSQASMASMASTIPDFECRTSDAELLSQASMASMASTIPDFECRTSDIFDDAVLGYGNISGDESVASVALKVHGHEAGQSAGLRSAGTKRRALESGGGEHTVNVSDEVACRAAYIVSRFMQLLPTLDTGTAPCVEYMISSIAAHELPSTSGNARSVPKQPDTSCNTPQQLNAAQLRLRNLELEVHTVRQRLEHGSVGTMVPSKRARVSPSAQDARKRNRIAAQII